MVIVVRHPFAFVSSLKRLNWQFDFGDLLSQPLLMRDHLDKFRDNMQTPPDDVIDQGCLLWRMLYTIVDGFRETHPEFLIVRHEDLSLQPEERFRDLYSNLSLDYSPRILKKIIRSSQEGNPVGLSSHQVHAVKLNSKANINSWKKRLTDHEVNRIRNSTADIALKYYPDESWL